MFPKEGEESMPEFQNREEYERWKAEKMRKGAQTAIDIEPEIEKKKTGKYIWGVVLVVIALSIFIIYKQFFQMDATWTDTLYTNWALGFSMDIPEGWDKYDFTLKEKAMFKMEKLGGSIGKILFALAPDNRRDTAYIMVYIDLEGKDSSRVNDKMRGLMNSFASAMAKQSYKAEQFEKTIAGIDSPFMRAYRGENIFIMGNFSLSPEKILMVQFFSSTREYEGEFWQSIESFELLEE